MKSNFHPHHFQSGYSLIEVIIAIGVLAVCIPLVFATLAQAGKTGMSSEAETRCSWIVPACMEEIRASRDGRPQYFAITSAGGGFPVGGDVWALAFGPDGRLIGKVPKILYEKGLKEIDGKPVLYLATLSAVKPRKESAQCRMLDVWISILYPAAVPEAKRQKLDFFTRIQ